MCRDADQGVSGAEGPRVGLWRRRGVQTGTDLADDTDRWRPQASGGIPGRYTLNVLKAHIFTQFVVKI